MRQQSGRSLPLAAGGALIRAASRHGSVFSFHGVRTDADPVASIANVTLRTLRQSVELIQASAEIVGLDELHCRWEQGKSTRGLVAMTFDDAYASLLETADAWLLRGSVPADHLRGHRGERLRGRLLVGSAGSPGARPVPAGSTPPGGGVRDA